LAWYKSLTYTLIVVQRGNAVISKSSSESRIRSNFQIFDLDQTDFEAVEGITKEEGQVRFGDWDDLWGSSLFGHEML